MPLLQSKLKNLKKEINCCKNHVGSLARNETVVAWMDNICKHLTAIGEEVIQLKSEATLIAPMPDILVYLSQMITLTKLMGALFQKEQTLCKTLTAGRECFTGRLLCCLDSLHIILNGNGDVPPGTSFVELMDDTLVLLSSMNPQKASDCEEANNRVEETLSHAMSIAQVCPDKEFKVITGACQAVLNVTNCLLKEINEEKPNSSMIKLFVNSCIDKMEALEMKVNSAVLKLCLNCFSQLTGPLERVYDFCLDVNNTEADAELDDLIANFDLHVDRLIQIGLFALACTKDTKYKIEIKNCLSSLEALENEIIPAFISMLNHNFAVNYAVLLKEHWIREIFILQKTIYLIIEPFAFTQIIYGEAYQLVDDLSQKHTDEICLTLADIVPLIQTAKVLQKFLVVIELGFSDNRRAIMKPAIENLDKIIDELHCASNVLLLDKTCNLKDSSRVLKRCKVLVTCIKRHCHCLPENISDEVTISSDKELVANESLVVPLLSHIIAKGKSILNERSMMYRTPIKANLLVKKSAPSLAPVRTLDKKKLNFSHTKNDSCIDLYITDILNEASDLSKLQQF